MKLIFCTECHDVVKLQRVYRTCSCGKSGGMYRPDGLTAIVSGNSIPIGIANKSFTDAIKNRPAQGTGSEFCAFVIPEKCDTIDRY